MDFLFALNCFFVVLNGYLCWYCFKDDNPKGGWINLFASAINAGVVAQALV